MYNLYIDIVVLCHHSLFHYRVDADVQMGGRDQISDIRTPPKIKYQISRVRKNEISGFKKSDIWYQTPPKKINYQISRYPRSTFPFFRLVHVPTTPIFFFLCATTAHPQQYILRVPPPPPAGDLVCHWVIVCGSGILSLLTLNPTLVNCVVKLKWLYQLGWNLLCMCKSDPSVPQR